MTAADNTCVMLLMMNLNAALHCCVGIFTQSKVGILLALHCTILRKGKRKMKTCNC